MADANSSSTNSTIAQKDPAGELNRYSSFTPEYRREIALEMATEMFEDRERMYAVANALLARLLPANGEAAHDIGVLRLAEVLNEMMSDCDQHYRLIDCLKAMQTEGVCHG